MDKKILAMGIGLAVCLTYIGYTQVSGQLATTYNNGLQTGYTAGINDGISQIINQQLSQGVFIYAENNTLKSIPLKQLCNPNSTQ